MPISDEFVVQYLLEGTASVPQRVVWQDREGHYTTRIGDVSIELRSSFAVSGSRWTLKFLHQPHEVFAEEPAAQGFFGAFEDENERRLAGLWGQLVKAVTHQCTSRKLYAIDHDDEVREMMYRRLLFGEQAQAGQ